MISDGREGARLQHLFDHVQAHAQAPRVGFYFDAFCWNFVELQAELYALFYSYYYIDAKMNIFLGMLKNLLQFRRKIPEHLRKICFTQGTIEMFHLLMAEVRSVKFQAVAVTFITKVHASQLLSHLSRRGLERAAACSVE